MKAKEIYKDKSEKVQAYMQSVIDCLEQDYGAIPNSWRVSLDLIADNYDIYLHAIDELHQHGLTQNYGGHVSRSPAFMIMSQAQNLILALLQQFALTPVSKSRIRKFDASTVKIEDLIQ